VSGFRALAALMALGGASLRSSAVPLTAEQRTARARKAADARHHPGADPAELERERTDRAIDDIVARAPAMTAEQAARISRMFTYIDPDAGG
jgi:hypothetical protein